MNIRKAAQQALEALEEYQQKGAPFMSCDAAVAALRAALAEDVPETNFGNMAQAVDSPVAYMMVNKTHGHTPSLHFTPPENWHATWEAVPLYAAPPKREPLTEESLENLFLGNDANDWWRLELQEFIKVARAIERAHGIGGEE